MRCAGWCGLVLLGAACLVAAEPGGGQDPVWLGDFDEARRTARQEDKPIFLVFRCER
ncbi:MAG: hypothetical protein WD403_07355 [Pirellulales bacterium]